MDRLPFRVSSDPNARDALRAFGPGNATLGITLPLVEPGTNRWILDDEHVAAWLGGQHDASWVAPGQDSTVQTINKLWLYGPPGSGRTLLAATLVDHLVRQLHVEPRHAVCYYFASDAPVDREAVVCLKALIAQLAQQGEAAYGDFTKAVKYGGRPSVHGFSDAIMRPFDAGHPADLGELLETLSRHFTQVSVVIRGVDYMEADLARQLTAMVDAPRSTIRTIFTSGDARGQQIACMETVSCPVEVAPSREEVHLYVRNEMKRRIENGDHFLTPEAPRSEIEEYILNNNHDSWLWAVTTLDDQCDLLRRNIWVPLTSRISGNTETQTSESSRATFDPYLERILRDEDPLPKFILTRTAHWLAMTENEPTFFLTAEEHVKALNALYRIENEEIRSSGSMIEAKDVLNACRPIVRLVDEAGVSSFRFKHKTVYDYMLRLISSSEMPLKALGYDGYTMGREFKDFLRICGAVPDIDAACAESLFKMLLSIHQKLFGHDDSYTLFIQDQYASFCWDQGRLAEAERLYLDIVQGFERAPPENMDAQNDVFNNLGIIYKRQERYDEAEHYYQAALRGREAQHGPAHESTLHTVSNIAQMYAAQGKTSTAQARWTKALPLCEKTFGRHHPKTLSIVYNLGLTHKNLGQYDEAETMLTRALSEHEQVFGAEHRDTLDVTSSLAHLYLQRDNDLAAEALYRRALASYESVQGPMGDNVLRTCHSLAKVYHALDRMQEAEVMGKRALHGFETTLGPDNIDATDVAYTLFLGYIEEERLQEAVILGQRVLAGFEKEHGGREGITASVADNMALAHAKMGDFEQAELLWKRACEGHIEARGEQHELSLAVVNNLGLLYMRQGRLEDAEGWLRRALQGYERLQGPEGDTTMRIARDLSGVYRDLGNFEESDRMASRGYQQWQRPI
ncbi:hypothetical protein PWT90_08656 [Aphanocladium album]|nr:hypothetical protein PWT90_08656 [Aphanocladium album]